MVQIIKDSMIKNSRMKMKMEVLQLRKCIPAGSATKYSVVDEHSVGVKVPIERRRSAEKSSNQQAQYDPFDPFSLASSMLMPCPCMEASNYLRIQWQDAKTVTFILPPTVIVPATIHIITRQIVILGLLWKYPSLRWFGNSLYGMHVSRGLKIEKDESLTKFLNEHNGNYECGSLSGEKENRALMDAIQ